MSTKQSKKQQQQQHRRSVDMTSVLLEMIRIFLPKVVLEIFGSGGAIWGFFEVVGLRTPATVWFWRPVSLSVAGIYFVRWLLQMNDHYHLILSRSIVQSQTQVDDDEEEEAGEYDETNDLNDNKNGETV
jgi:hypothetical protein